MVVLPPFSLFSRATESLLIRNQIQLIDGTLTVYLKRNIAFETLNFIAD